MEEVLDGKAAWAPPNDNCETYFILISTFKKLSCSIRFLILNLSDIQNFYSEILNFLNFRLFFAKIRNFQVRHVFMTS